ncbi:DUF4250 domain-containing protein [Clostridium paraputrificum]|uniref:DUF4250 domain-containing protein n=1 Tax=Clostridium TaxID=1485 RepID=UPI003D32B903
MDKNSIREMDPNILLSMINMKLRDNYSSLEVLCDDLEILEDDIVSKLSQIGYEYNKELNQFK